MAVSGRSTVGVPATRDSGVQEPIWKQARRRHPLVKIFNAVGAGLRRFGVRWPRPDAAAMLATASHRTGLHDFGDDRFREGLRILVDRFNAQDSANAFGRFAFRQSCTGLLINRLKIQADLTRHPKILDVPIHRPLFITGPGRSGTTLLHRIMSQAPACRPLLQWEASEPSPPPRRETYATDPRIARARQVAAQTGRLAPWLTIARETEPESPDEDNNLFDHAFHSGVLGLAFDVPDYLAWWTNQDHVWSYQYARQQLQLLSWQCPGEYWVLKSPFHQFKLDALLTVFPDACVVMTHRDPLRVVPSGCSLLSGLQGILTDRLDRRRLGAQVVEHLTLGCERAIAARARSDPARFFDVSYDRMVADPIETVRAICQHFGYDFDAEYEARARRWLAENPQHKHGVHRYQLEDFGLDAATVERSFAGYRQWLTEQRIEIHG